MENYKEVLMDLAEELNDMMSDFSDSNWKRVQEIADEANTILDKRKIWNNFSSVFRLGHVYKIHDSENRIKKFLSKRFGNDSYFLIDNYIVSDDLSTIEIHGYALSDFYPPNNIVLYNAYFSFPHDLVIEEDENLVLQRIEEGDKYRYLISVVESFKSYDKQ